MSDHKTTISSMGNALRIAAHAGWGSASEAEKAGEVVVAFLRALRVRKHGADDLDWWKDEPPERFIAVIEREIANVR